MKRTFSGMLLLLLAFGSANAALLSRAGGQAYYDDVLDITWLTNANLADTNDFGVTGINANGTMTWTKANEWIGAMNTANYLGTNDWRLPTVEPLNGSTSGCNQLQRQHRLRLQPERTGHCLCGGTASEMAHMFYNTLDNKGYCNTVEHDRLLPGPGRLRPDQRRPLLQSPAQLLLVGHYLRAQSQ